MKEPLKITVTLNLALSAFIEDLAIRRSMTATEAVRSCVEDMFMENLALRQAALEKVQS